MKNLVLFRNLNNLKTDECFLNDILAISTNIPPNLSIYERPPKKTQEHTSEDESKKSSIFDLCLENTLPYLEIILESPHHSLTSLDLDSKEILLTNCCLSALQTFRYLQQKDSYTDLKYSLQGTTRRPRNGLLTTNGAMLPARGIAPVCCGGIQRGQRPIWHTTLRSKV